MFVFLDTDKTKLLLIVNHALYHNGFKRFMGVYMKSFLFDTKVIYVDN